jgi:amino acid transporter
MTRFPTVQIKKLVAILTLGLMVYINMTSVKLYVRMQNIFMVFKIGACVLVIVGGIWWLATGHTELLNEPFRGTTTSPGFRYFLFYIFQTSLSLSLSLSFTRELVKAHFLFISRR